MRSISPRRRRVDQHRGQAAGDAGEACVAFHDETVRNVKAKRVQCDEMWAFAPPRTRTCDRKRPGRRWRHLDVDRD